MPSKRVPATVQRYDVIRDKKKPENTHESIQEQNKKDILIWIFAKSYQKQQK